jgi:uncharacterized protein
MMVGFFFALRQGGLTVSLTELLALFEVLRQDPDAQSAEQFYFLARTCLVKDERLYDRFDRVFAEYFEGAERAFDRLMVDVPSEWLRALGERLLSAEEMRQVQALGGWDKLLETLRERLAEQRGRHQGGNKWIGTEGTSPYGANGYNPEGVRIGQERSRHRRAVKVWDRRDFRNLDDRLELGTRNFQIALRRLRRFAREGAAEELDLDQTIDATARNAGLLDLKLVAERRNTMRLLLLLDVGGSMDDHVRLSEELFSAARNEFRQLRHLYFHNFIYERLWRDNRRRHLEVVPTQELIRSYGPEYRVVLIGDASMSPYEILQPGGSVEHWNEEAGVLWMQRLTAHFPHLVWLNPEPESRWEFTTSVRLIKELVGERMFPLTLDGLNQATAALRRRGGERAH